MSMGGAYNALSDEPLGLSWNPAGVVGFEEIYITLDWSFFKPSGSYDFNSGSNLLEHSGGSGNFLRNFVIVAPMTIKNQVFTVGLALSHGMDTYQLFADKIFPHTSSPLDVDITYEREGSLSTVHLGGATKASETIQLGATANIHFGKVVIDQNRSEVYQNSNTSAASTVHTLAQSVRQLDSFSLSGLNFTFGAIVNLTDDTRFGLKIRTPFKMTMSDDISIYKIITINDGQDIFHRSDTLIASNRSSQLEIPLMVTLGLAHHWSEKLLTSFDFDYRAFGGTNFDLFVGSEISPQGNEEIFRVEIPTDFSSVIQLRFGGEYTMESKYGLVPLRAGFGILQQPFRDVSDYLYVFSSTILPGVGIVPAMPVPSQKFNDFGQIFNGAETVIILNEDVDRVLFADGDQVTAFSFSLGFGLHSEQRKIDFAYSYTTYAQKFTTLGALELYSGAFDPISGEPIPYDPNSNANPNDPTYQRFVSRTSESRVRDHRFMISFTGYF